MAEMNALDGLRTLANRHPMLKSAIKAIARPLRRSISDNYVELSDAERDGTFGALKDAWQAPEIPRRQWEGVDRQLAAYRDGVPMRAFDVLAKMVSGVRDGTAPLSVLEVGCSSGYCSEALAIKGVDVEYAGCDYSPSFIQLAKARYPGLDFRVEDATSLGYVDHSFDVVVSGCCLLHIPDYEAAIRESARVARRNVIFHRTPVLHQSRTRFFTKSAYGVKTIEIHFNEHELVSLFARYGLSVVDIETLDATWQRGDAYATKTYLCVRGG